MVITQALLYFSRWTWYTTRQNCCLRHMQVCKLYRHRWLHYIYSRGTVY